MCFLYGWKEYENYTQLESFENAVFNVFLVVRILICTLRHAKSHKESKYTPRDLGKKKKWN